MSKLENNIVNNIKLLSLDMILEGKCGNPELSFCVPQTFAALFLKHLKFDKKNPKWINRDRVIISNDLLPTMYATMHMMGFDISLDNLKDYNKFKSNTKGFCDLNTLGIDSGNLINGDTIPSSVGVALGERYLESLIKLENPKCDLINFRTYCICTYKELLNGISLESLLYLSNEKLNKLTFVVIKDKNIKDDNLTDKYTNLRFNVILLNDNDYGSIDEALEEAKDSKKPTIIFINSTSKEYKNSINEEKLNSEHIISLRQKYKLEGNFTIDNSCYEGINKALDKRLNKVIEKWKNIKNEYKDNLKIQDIINLLENNDFKLSFNADNLKINDNYDEELVIGNNKIFNVFASKSPFVLNLSKDHNQFINKAEIMNYSHPTGRNIVFEHNTLAMGGIANGLASLGFKVFVASPLIESSTLKPFITYSTRYNLAVNYVFYNDSFLNSYKNRGISCLDEINSLRLISNLINFRPADINEIIGVYNIIANYKRCYTIILGEEKAKKLEGTNQKYVMAGAYRIKRERGEANGVLIASGTEVGLAIKVAEELLPYGIDLRVVSAPSLEMFEMQNDRYRCSLLPSELKTFVIEFGSNNLWQKYTDKECIFSVNDYVTSGTKEEVLKYLKLDLDSIKTKIIEVMKNN